MEPSLILLILRLVAAGVLLAFLFLIVWFILKDMRTTAAVLSSSSQGRGQLRVVANESGVPAVDTVYPLRPVTSIGRANSNTIVLEDDYASGEHALITQRGELWWLEDLGSRNGMLLNEVRLAGAAAVSAGDVITIGSTKLKIEF